MPSNKTLKILKLPAWLINRFDGHRSTETSFFVEGADSVQRNGNITVDVLMPKIYSIFKLPRLRRLPIWGKQITTREKGENWIGYYPYILPWSRQRNWRYFGEKLFVDYVNKHGKPDVIWCAGVLWSGFLANHLFHKYGIPYFIVEHSNGIVMDKGQKKSRKIKNEIIGLFREAFFCGALCTQSKERMQNFLGNDINLQIFPNVLSKEFEQINIDRKTSLGRKSPFILHNTARLDDNKNHVAIIEAFAQFCQSTPNSLLNIAGEGKNYGAIKQQISKLQLENKVNMLGYLSRDELVTQLLKSSAMVTASYQETFNYTIIEALACGTPCISTPAGVAEDAINQSNGVVVKSTSAKHLLQGMHHVHQHCATYDKTAIRATALRHYTGAVLADIIYQNLI